MTPAHTGNDKTKHNSRVTRSYRDAASFLAEIGELRKAEVPDSYAPARNTTFLQRALAGK